MDFPLLSCRASVLNHKDCPSRFCDIRKFVRQDIFGCVFDQ